MILPQLVTNLREQIELHSQLLELILKEVDLPANCLVEELKTLHEERETKVTDIFRKELERKKLVNEFAKQNTCHENPTLAEILEHCTEPFQVELRDSRAELSTIVTKVQEAGHQMAEIAKSRLHGIQEMQSAIHKMFYRRPTYSDKGKITQPQGACLMKKCI